MRMLRHLIVFAFVVFSAAASAITFQVRLNAKVPELWVQDAAGTWIKDQDLGVVPKGTHLYHWAPEVDGDRWLSQGQVDQGELDFLMKGSGAQGGGFYASLNPNDSASYGPRLAVIEAPTDLLRLETGQLNSRTAYGVAINERNAALAAAGVHIVRNSGGSSWQVIIRQDALSRVLPPNDVDFSAMDAGQLLRFPSKFKKVIQDPSHPFWTKQPELYKALMGAPLTPAESARVWTTISGDLTMVPRQFRLNLARAVRSQVNTYSLPGAGVSLSNLNKPGMAAQLDATVVSDARILDYTSGILGGFGLDLGEMIKDPNTAQTRLSSIAPQYNATPPKGWGEKFSEAFEFIDAEDIKIAAAKNHPAPWTVYDEAGKPPLVERWKKAETILQNSQTVNDLKRTQSVLATGTDAVSDFRDLPIVAGGDIYPNGSTKGYYRITAEEKTVLLENPFLATEVIDDPRAPGKYYLARHEYPSASTYKRANFDSFLSPTLVQKLDAAQAAGSLRDVRSMESRALTREILEELVARTFQQRSPHAVYQSLIAVHPFGDFNGRTCRLFFKASYGQPLYLRDWNQDLYLRLGDFVLEASRGKQRLANLRAALGAESLASFPRYYDLPEVWGLAPDGNAPADRVAAGVAKAKAYYSDPRVQNLARQKRFNELKSMSEVCKDNLTALLWEPALLAEREFPSPTRMPASFKPPAASWASP